MQLLNWFAINESGDKICEQSHKFSDINKEDLLYFGMEGSDTIFKHNVKTGQIEINENKILLGLNYKLIGRSVEVINFKEKLDIVGQQNQIIGYYTGWKEKNENFDYIEALIWADMNEKNIKLRLRLTPKINSCDFNIIINGEINTRELKFSKLNTKQEFIFNLTD